MRSPYSTPRFALMRALLPSSLSLFLSAFRIVWCRSCPRSLLHFLFRAGGAVSLCSIGVGTWEASSVSTGQRAATISSIPRLRLLPQFLCSCHAEDLCGHNTICWPQCTQNAGGSERARCTAAPAVHRCLCESYGAPFGVWLTCTRRKALHDAHPHGPMISLR